MATVSQRKLLSDPCQKHRYCVISDVTGISFAFNFLGGGAFSSVSVLVVVLSTWISVVKVVDPVVVVQAMCDPEELEDSAASVVLSMVVVTWETCDHEPHSNATASVFVDSIDVREVFDLEDLEDATVAGADMARVSTHGRK